VAFAQYFLSKECSIWSKRQIRRFGGLRLPFTIQPNIYPKKVGLNQSKIISKKSN
jgi:hypothetical protein